MYVAAGGRLRRKTSSAATRRSSAAARSACGIDTTAASNSWSNSRPMQAPICATSFTGARRSSRAISESCSVAGIAKDGSVPTSSYWSPVLRRIPVSSTAFVSSSVKSGTPSVRARICARSSAGSALPPVIPSTSATTWACGKRFNVSNVTCGNPIHGGESSGRNVATSSTGRF